MKSHQYPPNSPDLNPIENIWAYMKYIIAKDYPHITSIEEMNRVMITLWTNFANDKWNGLIESVPNRMQTMKAAKGGQRLMDIELDSKSDRNDHINISFQ